MSIYVWWIHYRSLCIAYCGSTNVFQMSLTQKFKDAVSGAAVNITALYTHAVPCATLWAVGYQVRDGRACNPPRGGGRQCIHGISAASRRLHNYGRGHGGYKQPYNSVLPYIQREARKLQSPYVTDGCIIQILSLYYRPLTIWGSWIKPSTVLKTSIALIGVCNIETASLFKIKSRVCGRCGRPDYMYLQVILIWYSVSFREWWFTFFISLMNTVEGFNPASAHGGNVKKTLLLFVFSKYIEILCSAFMSCHCYDEWGLSPDVRIHLLLSRPAVFAKCRFSLQYPHFLLSFIAA